MEEGAQDGPADSPARTDPLQQKAVAEDHEQDDAHAGDQIDDVYHGAKFLEGLPPLPEGQRGFVPAGTFSEFGFAMSCYFA